jgi:hypothetical protein
MAEPTNPIPRTSPFFKAPRGTPQQGTVQPQGHAAESDPAIDAIVAAVGPVLQRDFGTDKLPNPDGWVLTGMTPRKFNRLGACATFTLQGRTLCALVTPTDEANENPYFRTAHYDMAYFFEGVPEDERSAIWQQNRALLDGLASWLGELDPGEAS